MSRESPSFAVRLHRMAATGFACVLACLSLPVSAAPPELMPDHEALVRDLADEKFSVRERATTELWTLGEEALPWLERAAVADDPERAVRARQLLRKIRMGIRPWTDEAVVALIESYRRSSPAAKGQVFRKLAEQKAWIPMLHLYREEKDGELLRRLRPGIDGVVLRAARARIDKGDAKGALEALRLAPEDDDSLTALAAFHRSIGTLDEEIRKVETKGGSARWRMALYRVAGNLEAAERAARACGADDDAAALAGLRGNPMPWLVRTWGQRNKALVTAYGRVAARRWAGMPVEGADFDFILGTIDSDNDALARNAVAALFLLGQRERGEEALRKRSPLGAFRHLESLERIPEALAVLKIDPAKPDFGAWVKPRFESYLDAGRGQDGAAVSEEPDTMLALAVFLGRRGLHDDAYRAFAPSLLEMGDADEEGFSGLLGALFGSPGEVDAAPVLAARIGSEWAGNDVRKWRIVLGAAFGDEGDAEEWWDWLGKEDAGMDEAARLGVLLAMNRMGPDPGLLREKWIGRAIAEARRNAAGGDHDLADRLLSLLQQTRDAQMSLEILDSISPEQRAALPGNARYVWFSALDRWPEAAEAALEAVAATRESDGAPQADWHAHAAVSLRRCGREREAVEHDKWAERLALGDAATSLRIAVAYGFGRDRERAALWNRRAAREARPRSGIFFAALRDLADDLMEQGNWGEAASVAEMQTNFLVGNDYNWDTPMPLLRQRLQSDTMRALATIGRNRAAALGLIAACHRGSEMDGSLADFFFPALRKAGLREEHDRMFAETWERLRGVVARYPDADNTRNTAAWFAGRAVLELDEAEEHIRAALKHRPQQASFLDTYAEIRFSQGRRKEAVEWSGKALRHDPNDLMLRRQHTRFHLEDLPVDAKKGRGTGRP
jgi:tetratricopeptide (TPR) repeat protein